MPGSWMDLNYMLNKGRWGFTLKKNKKTIKVWKVLSLLEACFDLILGSSLSMKIQIMGWKITENLGFKSLLRKVKIVLFFFSFHFRILYKKVDIIYFDHFLVSCLIN